MSFIIFAASELSLDSRGRRRSVTCALKQGKLFLGEVTPS